MNTESTQETLQLLEDWYNHMRFHGSRHIDDRGTVDELLCFLQWRADGKPVIEWLPLPEKYKRALESSL